MEQVIWLSAIGYRNKELVGSKAARLGALLAAGMPVPDGFCVRDCLETPTSFEYLEPRSGMAVYGVLTVPITPFWPTGGFWAWLFG